MGPDPWVLINADKRALTFHVGTIRNFSGFRTSQELEPIAMDLGDILDEIFMDVGIDMTRTMSELL